MRRRRQSSIKRNLYEYELDGYDMDAPIAINNRQTLLTAPAPAARAPPSRRAMPLLGDLDLETADPLSPAVFLGHHKRCEKEEKRLMEADRLRLVSSAERILEQQRTLQGPYWQREIANIVQIDNPQNTHEIRTKRRLALEELALFMKRFEMMESERKLRQRRYTEPTRKKPPRPHKPPKRKSVHLHTPPARPEPPREPKVWIYIPPRAFGVCMPQLSFRPQAFDIPRSWKPQEESNTPLPNSPEA